MDPVKRIPVYGATGFVGSNYLRLYPEETVAVPREVLAQEQTELLYAISTTHNYHIFDDPFLDIETNLTRLIQTLEANKRTLKTFNFLSSWFVYGKPAEPGLQDSPRKESDPCDPTGFYSITKLAAERMLACWCKSFGVNYRIMRLANVIGPGDAGASPRKNALTYLAGQLAKGEPIKLYSGGDFTRDYIHVDDACRAIHLILKEGGLDTIYNVGSGVPYVFGELIKYARARSGSKSVIESVEPPGHHKNVQVESFAMDVSRLRALGFECKYTAQDALDQILAGQMVSG